MFRSTYHTEKSNSVNLDKNRSGEQTRSAPPPPPKKKSTTTHKHRDISGPEYKWALKWAKGPSPIHLHTKSKILMGHFPF